MKLHFRQTGEGHPVIILHGLLGSSDNWQTFGKQLAEKGYQVIMADLRNHGLSPHDDLFTVTALADDVKELINDLNFPKCSVIGHSLGGKTVMQLAINHADVLDSIIVIDIAPRKYKMTPHEVIEALNKVNLDTVHSRQDAETALSGLLPDKSVVQWLLKSLKRTGDGKYQWRFNLPVITSGINNTGAEIQVTTPVVVPSLFIRGEKSNYINDQDEKLIKDIFPEAHIKTAPGAGHWVHAENPQWLLNAVCEFFENIYSN